MTIGPDPRIMILWMSVRLGIVLLCSGSVRGLARMLENRKIATTACQKTTDGWMLLFSCVPDHGRANEITEERMRLQRRRLEFGMELAGDEPGVLRVFDNLDQVTIW